MAKAKSLLAKRPKAEQQPRLSRQDWIDGTIRKLSEDSVAALRVDELAEYLSVTKGSFYWHFQSREDLLSAVLAWWRQLMTSEIKSMIGNLPDTGWERLANLLKIAISTRPDVPGGPFELTLRDWARRDSQVAKVVQEVDEDRVAFVAELYRDAGLDARSAQDYAFAQMAFVIGARTAFRIDGSAEINRRRRIAEMLLLPRHLSRKGKRVNSMRVRIVGAGPAGLYLAIRLKRSGLVTDLSVIEQNAPDSTFGFGVVFSDNALEFLREDDPETHDAITPDLERWQDIKIVHAGETITVDGVGFTAVGRLHLLQLLQREAIKAGVNIEFNRTLKSVDELGDVDLIIGADGINSIVRQSNEAAFGNEIKYLTNRFVWFGTTKRFDALTQTFVKNERGYFNAHHYRYSPSMSTFIIECDQGTFAKGDLAGLSEERLKTVLEDVFAETLEGHPLVSNRSIWRQFPVVSNRKWSDGNKVILGDALHTAHFSIGSGTRLALEDAIALVSALKAEPRDMPAALARYEVDRKPVLDILVNAANASASWYENFAEKMPLEPYDFAMSYLMRTQRMTPEKLRRYSPKFMAAYDSRKQS